MEEILWQKIEALERSLKDISAGSQPSSPAQAGSRTGLVNLSIVSPMAPHRKLAEDDPKFQFSTYMGQSSPQGVIKAASSMTWKEFQKQYKETSVETHFGSLVQWAATLRDGPMSLRNFAQYARIIATCSRPSFGSCSYS